MLLREKIKKELTGAIKNKEELRSSVLRLLIAAVLNKEKEKRYKSGEEKDILLTDEETTEVIVLEVKKRKEAVSEYQKGQRQDLADKEKKEAEILQEYLPEQLSEQELKEVVKEAIVETGAKESKDMGKVMSVLAPKIKGRADGGLVSGMVKEALN